MIEHLTIEQFDFQEFPSGPVVRTLSFHCSEDPGSFPDQGTRILQLCGKTQKKKKKKRQTQKGQNQLPTSDIKAMEWMGVLGKWCLHERRNIDVVQDLVSLDTQPKYSNYLHCITFGIFVTLINNCDTLPPPWGHRGRGAVLGCGSLPSGLVSHQSGNLGRVPNFRDLTSPC